MRKNDGTARGRVVLVGTYKGDQLKDWPGWYCWPLDAGVSAAKNAKAAKREGRAPSRPQAGGPPSPAAVGTLPSITELWLYKGTADERRYRAEFVGVKTREELISSYDYPGDISAAKNGRAGAPRTPSRPSKPHGTHYALFKTELLYRHRNDLPGEADAVIVRLKDFARTPKVRKQLREYLESPDRNDPDLAKLLPSIVTSVPPERLRVCEAAVQMRFWDLPELKDLKPDVPFPAPERGKFTFIDLFAGIGGIRLGYQACGGKCVFSSEWDKEAAKTYYSNFGEQPWGDIQQIDPKDIPDFDVLLAGFPCQPFSIIGDKEGFLHETQGTLVFLQH